MKAKPLEADRMPSGPEREIAERELRAMQSEARGRAERPEDAATLPDAEPPSPTVAERLRPAGMFLAGAGTGVVSGSLGPPGMAAHTVINAKVERNGTPTDRFAFRLGQEVAGAFHIIHGIAMAIGNLAVHDVNPAGSNVDGELLIDAPYDFLVSFVASEGGHNSDSPDSWLATVDRALSGTPVENCEGNAWCLEADAHMATLTNEHVGPPWHVGTLPTSMLRDALERWRTFLETSGKGYRRELAPA